MTRMNNDILVFAFIFCLALSNVCCYDCGNFPPKGTMENPEQFLVVFRDAMLARNYEVVICSVHPSQRPSIVKTVLEKKRYDEWAVKVEELVTKKFGKDIGNVIAQQQCGIDNIFANSLLRWPDEEVHLSYQEDLALVLWKGYPTGMVLDRVQGRWYLKYTEPDSVKEELHLFRNVMSHFVKRYKRVANVVGKDETTAESVVRILDGSTALTVGGGRGSIRKEKAGE